MDDKIITSGQNMLLATPKTAVSSVRPKRIFSAAMGNRPHHLPPIGNQRGQLYRDPDMYKIAPQNLMNDRRICRGNTFAALVIPVNMQPLQRPQTHVNTKRAPANFQIKQRVMSSRNPRQNFSTNNLMMGNRSDQESGQQFRSLGQGRVNSAGRFANANNNMMQQDYNNNQNSQQYLSGVHLQGNQAAAGNHNYEDLSDIENMCDEDQIEPDYFVDKAPGAIFVPDSPKHDKMTNLDDRKDPDLFDFHLEIEPILQVLVGKALESSLVELAEEYEIEKLLDHRKKFAKVRESELLETQRLEGQRIRFGWEMEQRVRQHTAEYKKRQTADHKQIARYASKKLLRYLKRDTMKDLLATNILISRKKVGIEGEVSTKIHEDGAGQALWKKTAMPLIDEAMVSAAQRLALSHKQAMKNHFGKKRKQQHDEKQASMLKDQETLARKHARGMKREELLICQRMDDILYTGFHQSELIEGFGILECYVLDISNEIAVNNIKQGDRDEKGIIYTFGGMLGELIICFTCLADYVFANPANHDFVFTHGAIEQFLLSYYQDVVPNAPPMHVWLREEAESLSKVDQETFISELMQGEHLIDMGLQYLLQHGVEIQMQFKKVVKPLLEVIQKLANQQNTIEPNNKQIEGGSASDEEQVNIDEQQSEDENQIELIKQLGESVKVFYPQPGQLEEAEEIGLPQAFVKLRNYRFNETPGEHIENREDIDAQAMVNKSNSMSTLSPSKQQKSADGTTRRSQASASQISQSKQTIFVESNSGTGEGIFEIENISKVCIMMPSVIEDVPYIIQHTDAVFFIRKAVIEQAQKMWPEMKNLEVGRVLAETCQKQTILDQKFEQNLVQKHEFNYGMAYMGGINLSVLFKTTLELGHIPALPEIAEKEYMSMCMPPNLNSIDSGAL